MSKRIFISGASGLIGSNCQKHFNELGYEVIGSHFSFPTDNTVSFNTLDLTSSNNFDIRAFDPDVIIHCGALTWVDYCEEHPDESYEKTVRSTKNLVELSKELKAKLVYISTDYVFDGKNGPYRETDPTNALSIYGKHKLEGEELVQESSSEHLILRVTNVYGDEIRMKNFIARIIQQIGEGNALDLKLPRDQYATPVNALDVARCLAHLIADNKMGIYHIASTDYLNRVQLALRVLKYYPEATYQLESIDTASLGQAAPRPLIGGLISERFLSEYPEFEFTNVDDYLSEKISATL